MPNRLATETSPYLRQHADNPVDWYPWGVEALEKARREDKPILLSVGYSACHWCHVMAHESFENPAIAALMNELFVNIKVDREERPDVDGIYMQAVQALTGQGGWPMTVFLTPEGEPFHAGTYFPPEDRLGMRSFPTVLQAVADAYRNRRGDIAKTASQLREALQPPQLSGGADPQPEHLEQAERNLLAQLDPHAGGFGGAPKFPHPGALDFLLRRHVPSPPAGVLLTLDRMARGGIYDQLGGGFHRYSVDSQWAVPHFEKMLYDNAQLVPVYLHVHLITGDPRWRAVTEETLDYVVREMLLPEGGFASSQDADTEGEEGRFFVWTPKQLTDALGGDDAELAARIFGVTERGNFEGGRTVLSLPQPLDSAAQSLGMEVDELGERVTEIRRHLFETRSSRVAPGRDDKVVTSWNALMLAAFAEAGAALRRQDYVEVARRNADFLLTQLMPGGTLMRTWKDGVAKIPAFLQDVAQLSESLLVLYEATGDPRYFSAARELADDVVARFHDPAGGLFDTSSDADELVVRPKTLDDNPLPAGQSVAAHAFLRLHAFTGEEKWWSQAMEIIRPLSAAVGRLPLALASLAAALDLALRPPAEIAIAGEDDASGTATLVSAVHSRYHPARVLAWGPADGVPLLEGRTALGGKAAAYLCERFVCSRPVTTPDELLAQLEATALRG